MDGGVRERVVKLFCERDQRKTFLTSVLEYWKDWGGRTFFEEMENRCAVLMVFYVALCQGDEFFFKIFSR